MATADSPLTAPSLGASEVIEILRGNQAYVIGFTGPFGSGCSTAAHLLSKGDSALGHPPFIKMTLSDVLRKLAGPQRQLSRHVLQDLGNRLREQEGTHALAARALAEVLSSTPDAKNVALDGIRNIGEIRWLRDQLGDRFALFAVSVGSAETRFKRRRDVSQTWPDFYELDLRDQGESTEYGQQVGLCVDLADVLIVNDEELQNWQLNDKLGTKVRDYAALIQGRAHRWATQDELMMNIAYGASHGSKCIKRQVGAIIARDGEPLAHGYNENPNGLAPCIEGSRLAFATSSDGNGSRSWLLEADDAHTARGQYQPS